MVATQTTAVKDGFRVRFVYTIDGEEVTLGPFFAANQAEIDAMKTAKLPDATAIKVNRDVSKAIEQGITTSYGSANSSDVLRGYMSLGIDDMDTLQAYEFLKKVAADVLAMGYTDEQYAAAFDTSVDRVQFLKARWAYLEANEAAILAYKSVVDGDPI